MATLNRANRTSAFSLIELLTVVVVLGVLAAMIVFFLGGVTGKSAAAACNSDAKTVETAVTAFQMNNPSLVPTPRLLTSPSNGGPYLQSWPSNGAHYAITLRTTGEVMVAVPSKGSAVPYDTKNPCRTVS
jgi:prepilin-type N-terminal cleavage/methylation domain-containing protein